MTIETTTLRAAAQGALQQIGRKVTRVRGPQAFDVDSQRIRVRTSMPRSVMTWLVDDPAVFAILKHGVESVLITVPVKSGTLTEGVEHYLLPVARLRADFEKHRADWEKAHEAGTCGGDGKMFILYLDDVGHLESGKNFATKWAEYRVGVIKPTPTLVPTAPKPADEPRIRYVDFPRYRIILDGELLSAPNADGMVTLMRNTSHWTPSTSNADYMRQVAERMPQYAGTTVRTDTAEHFLEDMTKAGTFEWVKRELTLDEAA